MGRNAVASPPHSSGQTQQLITLPVTSVIWTTGHGIITVFPVLGGGQSWALKCPTEEG